MSRYTAKMGRRIFLSTIGCALLAAPVRAETKPPQSIPRLGVLLIGSRKDSAQARELMAFTNALSLLGWTERENYWMDARWAQEPETLPRLASDMVQQGVNVILAPGPQATRAARAATSIIPIVTIAGTDPHQVGAASLARPGGNITGLTIGEVEAVNAKRLQLITEAIPGIGQVAVVWDVKRGVDATAEALTSLDVAARSLNVRLQHLDIASVHDFENTFKAAKKEKSGAVLMVESPRAVVYRKLIADLALRMDSR
jgi:putative ABC transport system substrate-binding protein